MKMKNYISNLTNDELEWLCSEIPCERYEVFFRSHPDEFDQINISNPRDKKRLERCVNKILSSLTLDSVILFLNQNAENILVSFSKVLQCNEQNKTNQEILMAKTLRLFHFGGRVTLYFKLSNELDHGNQFSKIINSEMVILTPITINNHFNNANYVT